MALPTKMYATIAYIDRNTKWYDVDFYVTRRYDSDSMWHYIQRLCRRARRNSVRLLDITVKWEGGDVAWNWRSE